MRLSDATVERLAAPVARPSYHRHAQAVGIVHFGIGAFHRAHQALYTDKAMSGGDRNWSIAGVSLRSTSVAHQLNPQDGLYSLTSKSVDRSDTRLVAAVKEVLVAPEEPERVTALAAAPDTRILSFTITEKGYCQDPDGGLDDERAGDGSVYPFLAAAFERRKAAGLPGVALLSCDNLSANGEKLSRLVSAYLERSNPSLLSWFENECTCPSTMVDRIVPATTAEDRVELRRAIGLEDEGAVLTEPFSQWVIEDRFSNGRPRWEAVGAQFTDDVAPFETAKLRMLNGAHSALAYLGLERGHAFVHDAMADPELRALVDTLMTEEAAPTVDPASGQNLTQYATDLRSRFANAALPHRLAQIAMDGSQKIPQRWLETLAIRQDRSQMSPAILAALAAWLRHIRGDNGAVDDPAADELATLWRSAGREGIAHALFGSDGRFQRTWIADTATLDAICLQLRNRN